MTSWTALRCPSPSDLLPERDLEQLLLLLGVFLLGQSSFGALDGDVADGGRDAGHHGPWRGGDFSVVVRRWVRSATGQPGRHAVLADCVAGRRSGHGLARHSANPHLVARAR